MENQYQIPSNLLTISKKTKKKHASKNFLKKRAEKKKSVKDNHIYNGKLFRWMNHVLQHPSPKSKKKRRISFNILRPRYSQIQPQILKTYQKSQRVSFKIPLPMTETPLSSSYSIQYHPKKKEMKKNKRKKKQREKNNKKKMKQKARRDMGIKTAGKCLFIHILCWGGCNGVCPYFAVSTGSTVCRDPPLTGCRESVIQQGNRGGAGIEVCLELCSQGGDDAWRYF